VFDDLQALYCARLPALNAAQVTISMSTELPVVVRYHMADLGKLRCAQAAALLHALAPLLCWAAC
jgi:hypothetical protein